MSFEIGDLHCDLLLYLTQDKRRTPQDPAVRCSLQQLKRGGVTFQTMAVFTQTEKDSSLLARSQFEVYQTLEKGEFFPLKSLDLPQQLDRVCTLAAIENASGLIEEKEPLDSVFKRLNYYQTHYGPILYISLTWNTENRFGGGNLADKGLTEDGERLLEFLDGKGIAIDLSHTCDRLAEGILNHIDKKGLKLIPIASHSNFRNILSHPRNLPSTLAKEIISRGGVIGINAVRKFVGESFSKNLLEHIQTAYSLEGKKALCFGADFFYEGDIPTIQSQLPMFDPFFENSSCYPTVMDFLREYLPSAELKLLGIENLRSFLKRLKNTIKG